MFVFFYRYFDLFIMCLVYLFQRFFSKLLLIICGVFLRVVCYKWFSKRHLSNQRANHSSDACSRSVVCKSLDPAFVTEILFWFLDIFRLIFAKFKKHLSFFQLTLHTKQLITNAFCAAFFWSFALCPACFFILLAFSWAFACDWIFWCPRAIFCYKYSYWEKSKYKNELLLT